MKFIGAFNATGDSGTPLEGGISTHPLVCSAVPRERVSWICAPHVHVWWICRETALLSPLRAELPPGALCGVPTPPAALRRFVTPPSITRDHLPILVGGAKFRARLNLARLLGKCLANALGERAAELPELIVPVPLHGK